jgi:sugar-specific transcriptional regulator TrmB
MTKSEQQLVWNLQQLDLSKCEASVYFVFHTGGTFSINIISRKTGVELHTIYRVLKHLKNKGFAADIGGYPKKYQIYPLEEALRNVSIKQNRQVARVRDIFLHQSCKAVTTIPQTHVSVILDKEKIFAKSTNLIKESKLEVLIVSIGEEIPEGLLLEIRNALQREVDIRIIVHKYDKENKHILWAWKKMGIKVRHKVGWGFHLLVYDATKSLIVTNNPDNTKERSGLVIFNRALSSALREYFMNLWNEAKEIGE